MSDVHIWNVDVAGDVIGDIIESGSTFYTGPFAPGSFSLVASALIKNIGNTGGIMHYNLYEYPGAANENIVVPNSYYFEAGQQLTVGYNATIPDLPGQSWPLGIKVWGESEAEPNWTGAAGKLELPPGILAVGALAGLLGLAYLLTKK